LLIFNRFP